MKTTQSQPDQPEFEPFYCAAHHRAGSRTQFIVQLNPPFQFVAMVSREHRNSGNTSLILHLFKKKGWPTGPEAAIAKVHSQLLNTLETCFPDLPPNVDAELRDTHKTTDDMDITIECFFCESKEAGLANDIIVHIKPDWRVFAVYDNSTSAPPLVLIYSEAPQHSHSEATQIPHNPYVTRFTDNHVMSFYTRFIEELDQIQDDDFIR